MQLLDVEVSGAKAVGKAADGMRLDAFFEDGPVRVAGSLRKDAKLNNSVALSAVVALRDAVGRELEGTFVSGCSARHRACLAGPTVLTTSLAGLFVLTIPVAFTTKRLGLVVPPSRMMEMGVSCSSGEKVKSGIWGLSAVMMEF